MILEDHTRAFATQNIKKGQLFYMTKRNTLRVCKADKSYAEIITGMACGDIKKGTCLFVPTTVKIGELT